MKKNQFSKKIHIIFSLILIFCIAVDRITKIYSIKYLKDHPAVSLIEGVLEMHYLENNGAAFGLLKNQRAFFVFVGIIVMLAILYAVNKSYHRKKSLFQNICLVVILGGSIGNFIDRIWYGYVIDFIYFSSINFPVFNFADLFISMGTIFLIIFMLFYYKEYDLIYMEVKERKLREIDDK